VIADTRSIPQIQADALAALARHSLGCSESPAPLAKTTVVVRMSLEALVDGLGHARIDGIDVAADPVGAKRRIAFIPDEPRLFEHLTVAQHLAFVARLYGTDDYLQRVPGLLAELEMADKRDLLPAELSRGMKQKLAIACGLLHQPMAVILDEPMTGLDPVGMRRMKAMMRRLARDGAAIILSSHLLAMVEEVCTHLLILKDGRKVADGSVAGVRERFAATADSSLEDVFIRATGDAEASAG
jgi:ABC-2 type transport system ATP-binding protein